MFAYIYFVWCFLFGTSGFSEEFRLHPMSPVSAAWGTLILGMYWENQCIHRSCNSHKQMDGWLDVDNKCVFFYLEDLEVNRIKVMLWAYHHSINCIQSNYGIVSWVSQNHPIDSGNWSMDPKNELPLSSWLAWPPSLKAPDFFWLSQKAPARFNRTHVRKGCD